MRSRCTGPGTIAAALLAAASFGVPARAQHMGHVGATEPASMYGEKLKAGADGAFVFAAPTQVGDLLVRPGRYRMDHVVEGEDHFVELTNLERPAQEGEAPGRAKCRQEPIGKPAKRTEVHLIVRGALRTVVKVQFEGETVRHVF